MRKKSVQEQMKLRYNIITVSIYAVGIILIAQLFNLQIVHGEEYRTKSNTRLTRESTLEAARGQILDRNGTVLAGTKMGFSLELYKSKIDTQDLNNTILKMAQVLEQNEDIYVDSFPITINPFAFTFSSDEKAIQWKKSNEINENATAEEAFNFFKNKYKIQNDNPEEARKIIRIRYEITKEGYSNTKSLSIAQNISRASAIQFNEKSSEFPGLNVTIQPVRSYPFGNLGSHIIGYIGKIKEEELETRKDEYGNNDYIGRSGIESTFEKYLKGKNGTKQIDMAVDGTVTDEYVQQEAIAGADIVSSIDANLQKIAEDALKNNIEKIANGGFASQYDTNAGAVVAMNIKTGEVLALASYPDFEPQVFVNGLTNEQWKAYNDSNTTPLYNRAITGSYAPGSIFKMVPSIAALESGVTTIKEKVNDTGVSPYAGHPKCWIYSDYGRGHGWLNVVGAIQHSCNFYFYEMGHRMGIDTIAQYASYFGLGQKTGIELPSETSGTLASKAEAEKRGLTWQEGETLSSVIGQSYNNFSPLQMVKYIGMVANGGKKINPTIVKDVVSADGTENSRQEVENYVNEKLGLQEKDTQSMEFKQENVEAVLEGMRSVAMETGGTAYSIFKNFNIEVGGKTGSAEAGEKIHAWFAGFAPFDDPELALVVMVDNGGHGNYTAEVARDIIGQYFGMNANQVTEDVTAIPYTETRR